MDITSVPVPVPVPFVSPNDTYHKLIEKVADAQKTFDDAQKTFADAQKTFADAKTKLDDATTEHKAYVDGWHVHYNTKI